MGKHLLKLKWQWLSGVWICSASSMYNELPCYMLSN